MRPDLLLRVDETVGAAEDDVLADQLEGVNIDCGAHAAHRRRTLGDWLDSFKDAGLSDLPLQLPPPSRDDALTHAEEWPRLESNELDCRRLKLQEISPSVAKAWLGAISTIAAVTQPTGSMRRQLGGLRLQNSPSSVGTARRMPQSLRSALRTQAWAVEAGKSRGVARRVIGKKSRNDVRNRARKFAPNSVCGAAELAARPGRHAASDMRLANLMSSGLRLETAESPFDDSSR